MQGKGGSEPLDCRLGHRVTETAELRLHWLVLELRKRGRSAKINAVLDVIIKHVKVEEIEGDFPPRKR